MASKFHGEFEVTADFVNGCVSNYVNDSVSVGSWLVVGELHTFSYPVVYTVDDTREKAYRSLRWCVNSDFRIKKHSFDYEVWHVVETPDWMPETLEVLSIELVEHKARRNFDETLIRVNAWGLPRSGLIVLVTDWGYYSVTDWQGEQPISLRDMASNYECMEVTSADGLPTKEIDSFIEFCGMTANLGYKWDCMRGLKLSRGMLS